MYLLPIQWSPTETLLGLHRESDQTSQWTTYNRFNESKRCGYHKTCCFEVLPQEAAVLMHKLNERQQVYPQQSHKINITSSPGKLMFSINTINTSPGSLDPQHCRSLIQLANDYRELELSLTSPLCLLSVPHTAAPLILRISSLLSFIQTMPTNHHYCYWHLLRFDCLWTLNCCCLYLCSVFPVSHSRNSLVVPDMITVQ